MASDDLINQRLGQYEIKSVLGRGGMATVYLARQTSMERDVAVKVMAKELADDEQFVTRFEHEAHLIAQLQHPHILPVIDFGREGKNIFIVMRLVRGGSLDQRLQQGPLSLNTASHMLGQIASALSFAHEQGIIHRDLKPNNVLLDERSNAYLTDFGIAKMLAGTSKLTATGNILGTPAYMAPEQWRGEPVDARTDIYSLGVMLYEMVLGRLPFAGDTPFTLMYKHFNDAPPPPHALKPDVNPAIEGVILKSLSKHADQRYQSAEEMAEDFANAVKGLPTSARQTPPQGLDDKTIIGAEADAVSSREATMPPTMAPAAPPTPPGGAGISGPVTPPGGAGGAATPPFTPTPAAVPAGRSGLNPLVIAAAVVVVLALLGGGAFLAFGGKGDDNKSTPIAQQPTATDTLTPTEAPTNTAEPTHTPTEAPTITPSPTERTTMATVLVERANVRRGPGLEYEVLGTLARDQDALVNGMSEDGDWYQIVFGPQLGWISAETVRISGNPNISVVVWATKTPTPTDTPTHTPTPEPTDTPTETPTPTATDTPTTTPSPEPTETPQPTPVLVNTPDTSPQSGTPVANVTVDPAIFVPTEFSTADLSSIGVMLDYPTNWRPPSVFGVAYSLFAFAADDPNYDYYPSMVVARGTADQLVAAGLTSDGSSMVNAIEHVYSTDFTGKSQPTDKLNFPAYAIDLREGALHAWVWLAEIKPADWLFIIVLAPSGDYDKPFAEQALNHMLTSLTVDGQALTNVPPIAVDLAPLGDIPITLGTAVLDRFDDNTNDWQYATLSDGKLVLDTPEKDYLGWAYPKTIPEAGSAFYMQVSGTITRQPNFWEYGVAFRVSTDRDFYYFSVNHRGEYTLFSVLDSQFSELVGPTTSSLVNTGPNNTNTFGVLVVGDYIEIYLNNQFAGAAVDSHLKTGSPRVAAYTFVDSDNTVAVAFDDFAYLPLNVSADPELSNNASAVIATVRPVQVVTIQALPQIGSDTLQNLTQDQQLVVFGRTTDNKFLFAYARGAIGWIDSSLVDLTRGGQPLDVNTLPVIARTVQGIPVKLWPVIWPDQGTAAATPTPAVEVTLSYGQTINGTIAAGEAQTWTFLGSAGDVISLATTASSAQLDTSLALAGPDGSEVAQDDDSGPGLNALISSFTLPSSGVYTVTVSSVAEAGDFTLSLTKNN